MQEVYWEVRARRRVVVGGCPGPAWGPHPRRDGGTRRTAPSRQPLWPGDREPQSRGGLKRGPAQGRKARSEAPAKLSVAGATGESWPQVILAVRPKGAAAKGQPLTSPLGQVVPGGASETRALAS